MSNLFFIKKSAQSVDRALEFNFRRSSSGVNQDFDNNGQKNKEHMEKF